MSRFRNDSGAPYLPQIYFSAASSPSHLIVTSFEASEPEFVWFRLRELADVTDTGMALFTDAASAAAVSSSNVIPYGTRSCSSRMTPSVLSRAVIDRGAKRPSDS